MNPLSAGYNDIAMYPRSTFVGSAAVQVQRLRFRNSNPLSVTYANYPHSCCQDAIFEVSQVEKPVKNVRIVFTDVDVPPNSIFVVSKKPD